MKSYCLPIKWLTRWFVVTLPALMYPACILCAVILTSWLTFSHQITCNPFIIFNLPTLWPCRTNHFDSGALGGFNLLVSEPAYAHKWIHAFASQSVHALYTLYCFVSVSERKQVSLAASKVPLITHAATRQARPSHWIEPYACNAKPQCLTAYEHCPSSIDHASGSHCLMPNIRQSSGAHGRREKEQRGRGALRLLVEWLIITILEAGWGNDRVGPQGRMIMAAPLGLGCQWYCKNDELSPKGEC